jgi:hypothetical protein
MTISLREEAPRSRRLVILQNLSRMGRLKNIKTIGRILSVFQIPISRPALRHLEILIKVLERAYGENFDVKILPGESRLIYFLIKYPEVEITNSNEDTHIIKDLYVSLPVRTDGDHVYIYDILGSRGKLTEKEYAQRYYHSHLAGCVEPFLFTSFCLGTSDLEEAISVFRSQGKTSAEELELFLHCLDSYVKWESKEGVPYQYIEHIPFGGMRGEPIDLTTPNYSSSQEVLEDMFLRKTPLNLSFYVKNGEYKIDEKGNKTIEFFKNFQHFIPAHFIGYVIKDQFFSQGAYKNIANNFTGKVKKSDEFIFFNGKKEHQIISPAREELGINPQNLTVSPNFIRYVSRQYEKKLNSRCYSKRANEN